MKRIQGAERVASHKQLGTFNDLGAQLDPGVDLGTEPLRIVLSSRKRLTHKCTLTRAPRECCDKLHFS